MVDVVMAMISASSVNQVDLSTRMPGTASLEAKQRRVERGIRDKQLTAQVFLALLIWQLPKGKLLLSLDRTTWEHGNHPMNLLVLGAVVQGFTVPLFSTGQLELRALLDGIFWYRGRWVSLHGAGHDQ